MISKKIIFAMATLAISFSHTSFAAEKDDIAESGCGCFGKKLTLASIKEGFQSLKETLQGLRKTRQEAVGIIDTVVPIVKDFIPNEDVQNTLQVIKDGADNFNKIAEQIWKGDQT